MKILRLLAAAIVAVLAVSSSYAEPAAKRYIVGFKPQATQAERQAALKKLGVKAVDAIDEFDALVAEVPEGRFTALSEDAKLNPSILNIEEDVEINWLQAVDVRAPELPGFQFPRFLKASEVPSFPLPVGVDANEVPWGIGRVDAANAWARTQGQGVRVAVVDTGIDFNHPDLKANYAGGYNAIDPSAPPMDDNKHGTHVAGTIAGVWDNKGVVGVAPKARLYAVKVLNKEGSASLTSIIKGLVWCAKNNMQVANMSLGAPIGSIFMHLAVNYAVSKGVVIVAAAGNSGGRVGYPAGYDDVIAISASDVHDKIAEFSSRGSKVEFIAPGVAVKSSVPGGGYDTFSGTSMATPHVTGLAALAVAQGAQGVSGVRASLKRAAKSIGLAKTEEGNGLIDAAKVTR